MKSNKTVAIVMLITAIWWGALYPEFYILSDSCRVVYEEETVQDFLKEQSKCKQAALSERELALALMEAEPEDVIIKFGLWEAYLEWLGERQTVQ